MADSRRVVERYSLGSPAGSIPRHIRSGGFANTLPRSLVHPPQSTILNFGGFWCALVAFGGLWWPLVDSSLLGNPVNHANFVKRLKESKVLVKASALGFLCCLYSLLLNLRSAPICVDRFSPRFRFRANSCNSCLDHVWSSLVRQSDRPTIPIFIPVLDRFSGPEFFSGHFR
jgi:hypothetical protein